MKFNLKTKVSLLVVLSSLVSGSAFAMGEDDQSLGADGGPSNSQQLEDVDGGQNKDKENEVMVTRLLEIYDSKIKGLSDSNEKLQEALKGVTGERNNLKLKVSEQNGNITGLNQTIEGLQQKLEALGEEIDEINQINQYKELEKSTFESLESEYKIKVGDFQNEKVRLEAELTSSQDQVLHLKEQVAQLTTTNNSLSATIQLKDAQIASLQKKYSGLLQMIVSGFSKSVGQIKELDQHEEEQNEPEVVVHPEEEKDDEA